jgi:hypothetical protein
MAKLRHFVMLAVAIACGVGTIFSADRNYRPIARIDPSQELTKFAGSSQESIVPVEPLDDVRKAERSRRAVRPAGDPEREDRLNYKGVLKGWERGTSLPGPAEPMPPTYCRSIERPETHQGDDRTVRCPRPHCPLIREQIRFRVHAHVLVQE